LRFLGLALLNGKCILQAMTTHPTTASDFIDALGGTSVVGRLTKSSPQAVANWRARGTIPATFYLVLSAHAEGAGIAVDPEIFGIQTAETTP
jgi:hypothetical protein